ncbi:MAG: DUF6092 family protein [Anaerolineae bacterium]
MSQRMVVTEEDLYEVLSFLVSSAHLCVTEPRFYGTFRLIDAVCRLIGLALGSEQLEDDQFLREFKEDADQRKFLLVTDEEAYFEFLEDATRKMAKEMKRRACAD